MAKTADSMELWLRRLLGVAPETPRLSLREYLDGIPQLESLADVPAGTVVLLRGDVDAKPGPKVGEGDIRLRSMEQTLRYGQQKGWIQVIFGHIGRDPKGSLGKVRSRFAEILGCEVGLISDWLDPATTTILDQAAETVRKARPGSVWLLENTRKYDIETVLWKTKPEGIPEVAPKLARLATEYAQKLGRVYVNEAFSAGSLDSSTTVVPWAMQRVALGKYVAGQFLGPLMDCLGAQLVVSSGLKIDKLDDLEAMINRGKIRWVLIAGSLACGLKKAEAELEGREFSIGVAEDPAHSDKPYFIPRSRIEQAKRLLREGRQKGIQFVLPVDFVLQDGRISETIGPGDQQLDVGPATGALFEQKVGEFLQAAKQMAEPAVAFHNGVFGMFEDPRFEAGTRRFIPQLKRMKDAGVKVYVGGGEGGKALETYGQPDWVTHNFTAGGTVLNALGSEPVPYLVALWMAAQAQQ
ncbi:MAG: phosphoglycerate kinase [Thermoguttaceae bacterium]